MPLVLKRQGYRSLRVVCKLYSKDSRYSEYALHCVKSVQIRSFFWSVSSCIWTEYVKLRSESLYSVQIQENTEQKKLRIWRLFIQCQVLNMPRFCMYQQSSYARVSQGILTGILIYLGFWICQCSESVLEATLKQLQIRKELRYVGSVYDLKAEFFF